MVRINILYIKIFAINFCNTKNSSTSFRNIIANDHGARNISQGSRGGMDQLSVLPGFLFHSLDAEKTVVINNRITSKSLTLTLISSNSSFMRHLS